MTAARPLSLALVFAALACGASSAPAPTPETPAPPAPPACERTIDGLDELIAPGATLVLGELHGTVETQRFVGDVACHALRRAPTTIALEIPHDEQALIDAYLASTGDDAARAAVLAGAFWRRADQDGRSSEAMLGLIDRARVAGIAVLAYDVVDGESGAAGQPARDRQMAERIFAAQRAAPGRTFVILGGNYHSRRTIGAPWDPEYRPMAWSLADLGVALVTLDVERAGGSAWVCVMDGDDMVCGERGGPPEPVERVWYVDRATETDGHDGRYLVGPTTASPPAVR